MISCRRFVPYARPRLALGALAVLAACSGATPDAPPASTAAPARAEVIVLTEDALTNSGIVVVAAQATTRADRILAPGLIALDETRTARIGSLQEALILETPVQVGDRVRARQLLATMHGHAMHDAWAGYRKAIAEQRRLEKELTYAVDAHGRAQRLYDDKAISLQALQRADVERVSATQMVDMAKAEVSRSIEELEHVGVSAPSTEDAPLNAADAAAEQIPVRSPIGGVVLERLVTQGTTVTPGTPLFVVSDLSRLWVIAEIDESRLASVRTGRPVEVVVSAYPDERFSGTITFIADVVNPKTRRVTVRSVVPNPDGRLKPDMFATVALGQGEPRSMVLLPQAAVQTIDTSATVFVEEGNGRFRPRTVRLGTEVDGLVEVASGLTAGERVVVAGSFVLKSEMLKEGGQ